MWAPPKSSNQLAIVQIEEQGVVAVSEGTLTHKPTAIEQALRASVVDPDEGVHPIDLVLSKSPLKYRGHGLAHQSLAPVSLRQVERQLRPREAGSLGRRPTPRRSKTSHTPARS